MKETLLLHKLVAIWFPSLTLSCAWMPTRLLVGQRRALLEDCMRVLFYRDCRALNRIQIAKATVEGTVVSDAYTVSSLHAGWV